MWAQRLASVAVDQVARGQLFLFNNHNHLRAVFV
jgi:hypothetical protein